MVISSPRSHRSPGRGARVWGGGGRGRLVLECVVLERRSWSADTSGECVDLRTAWKVVDAATDTEIDGDEYNYHTGIEIRVPENSVP